MTDPTRKRYLGDGVYVSLDEAGLHGLWLITENGFRETNRIFLEPEVWVALNRWVDEVTGRTEEKR